MCELLGRCRRPNACKLAARAARQCRGGIAHCREVRHAEPTRLNVGHACKLATWARVRVEVRVRVRAWF